jgi:hypothetical protein
MREASFLYAELVQMGAGMAYIDCGGGLAVDYDGSFTDSHSSMSYTLQHYANDGGWGAVGWGRKMRVCWVGGGRLRRGAGCRQARWGGAAAPLLI